MFNIQIKFPAEMLRLCSTGAGERHKPHFVENGKQFWGIWGYSLNSAVNKSIWTKIHIQSMAGRLFLSHSNSIFLKTPKIGKNYAKWKKFLGNAPQWIFSSKNFFEKPENEVLQNFFSSQAETFSIKLSIRMNIMLICQITAINSSAHVSTVFLTVLL